MATAPTFSVIVPTYRRPAHLARCLGALVGLDYPADRYEIVVVDDDQSPETASQVDAVARAAAVSVRYVPQAHGGPASARNVGGAAARGRYLAFTDDDCQPSRGWLTALEAALATGPLVMAGGRTENAVPDLAGSVASQLLIDYLYESFRNASGLPRFFASNNMALPADAFAKLGGFDRTFPLAAGEDREFCERWVAAGGTLVPAPAASVRHWHALTLRRFVRQHFNYGRGADYLHRSRRRAALASGSAERSRLEPPVFYMRLLAYPFRRVSAGQAIPQVGLLITSQVVYAAGYGFQRMFGNRRSTPGA